MASERKTVFMVDDSASILTLGKDLLSDIYTALTFNSGEMMFKALEKKKPDIIILDVEMPEMNGYAIMERLKGNSLTSDIPVIFLTSQGSMEAELRGFSLGAVDYITKPFSAPLLLKRIEAHLTVESQRRELEAQKSELVRYNAKLEEMVEGGRALAERLRLIIDSMPFGCNFLDENQKISYCNQAAVTLHGMDSQEEFINKFAEFTPEFQPDGRPSAEVGSNHAKDAYEKGYSRIEWYQNRPDGKSFPVESTLVRVKMQDEYNLVNFMRDLTEHFELKEALAKLEAANQVLQYREELLNTTNRMSEALLTTNDENIVDTIMEGLKIVGDCLHLDRVQLWRIEEVDGEHMFALTHQWTNEIGDHVEIPLDMTFSNSGWLEKFKHGESINGPISELSDEDRAFLMNFDIWATVMTPMFLNNKLIGFFSADDCRRERSFSDDEKNMLASTGLMFTSVLSRVEQARMQEEMKMERDSNQLREIFLNASPIVMSIWDETRSIVSTNEKAMEMFGLSATQEHVERFFEFSPPFQPCGERSESKARKLVEQAFNQSERLSFEWIHQTAAGEEVPSEVSLVRIEQHGKFFVAAYTFDLRTLREAYGKIREAEGINEILIDSAPFAIHVVNEDADVLNNNRQAVELFGFSDKEEYLKNIPKLTPKYQPCGGVSDEMLLNHLKTAMAKGRTRFEWMHNTLCGEPIPTEITAVYFKKNDKNMIVTYTNDMRPVKAAMEAELIKDTSERVQLLFDVAPVAIAAYDDNLKLVNCNDETCRLYGFKDKDECLKEFNERRQDFFPPFQACGTPTDIYFKQSFEKTSLEGRDRFEATIVTVDGNEIPIEVTILRIGHHDSSFFVVYLRDLREINERKRAEVAEESNRAKSRFLARMSHEIRTPISAVLGISEIQLQNPTLSPIIEESFAKIHDSSNMLLGIINDILDLSKIEAGKMSLTHEQYGVASLINDAVQPYVVSLGDKDVGFNVHIDENMLKDLIGDPLRIKQIINNILSNSFKYTESGAVDLIMRHQDCETDKDSVMLVISIRDTGLGMTEEQVEMLFEAEYVRFHEREVHVAGTGLGMAIVKSLVQIMNAEIEMESEVGKGTSVTVRIPQGVAGAEVIGKETAESLQRFEVSISAAAKKFRFTPEPMPYGKVLVVDDVEANLYVARGLLAFYDLDIETCVSGREAIGKIRQGKVYDIVFMDQMMPGMDGTQAMNMMREMGYRHPIVALTANALIGQAEEFIKNGFDGFISKPIQTAHLNSILVKHIRDKQPGDVLEAANALRAGKTVTQEEIDGFQKDDVLVGKLRKAFIKGQATAIFDMNKALADGDKKTAHRLAHTLKSSAGLIHESALSDAAGTVEHLINDGQVPSESQMAVLESELTRVIEMIELGSGLEKPMNDFRRRTI